MGPLLDKQCYTEEGRKCKDIFPRKKKTICIKKYICWGL